MISYSFLCKARLAIYTIKGHRVLMRGTEGWVRGCMGLPSQLYAVKMQEWGGRGGAKPGLCCGCQCKLGSAAGKLQQAAAGLVDAKGLVTGRADRSLLF